MGFPSSDMQNSDTTYHTMLEQNTGGEIKEPNLSEPARSTKFRRPNLMLVKELLSHCMRA